MSNGKSIKNKTNNERQNHQNRKRIDKRQEEMDNLKSDIGQIRNTSKQKWIVKND